MATIDPGLVYTVPAQRTVANMTVNEVAYLPKDYVVADNALNVWVPMTAPITDVKTDGYVSLTMVATNSYSLVLEIQDTPIYQDTAGTYNSSGYATVTTLTVV